MGIVLSNRSLCRNPTEGGTIMKRTLKGILAERTDYPSSTLIETL